MKKFKLLVVFSVSLLVGFSVLYLLDSEKSSEKITGKTENKIDMKDVLPVTSGQSTLTPSELKTIELYEKASCNK